MEEKERYEWNSRFDEAIKDNQTDDIVNAVEVLNKQDKRIKELEAKLAESEEKVKHWHDLYNERDKQFQSVRQRYHLLNKLQSNYDKKDKLHLAYMQCLELVEENEKLKQQLAEKDKEIKQLKKFDDLNKTFFELFRTAFKEPNKIDDLFNILKTIQEKQHQDKISFAVEQLEKVEVCLKEGIEEVKSLLDPIDYEDYHELLGVGRGYRNSIEIIDNQIKAIKGEK